MDIKGGCPFPSSHFSFLPKVQRHIVKLASIDLFSIVVKDGDPWLFQLEQP